MSVPAWKNDFGAWSRYDNLEWSQINFNSAGTQTGTSSGTTRHHVAEAIRDNATKNGIVYIKGMPWRFPSSYNRITHVCHMVEADYTWILPSGSKQVRKGFPTRTDDKYNFLFLYPFSLGYGMTALTNEQNQANTEALIKLKDGKVNLGTLLAEAKKSVNTVADTFSALAQELLRLKRGQRSHVGAVGLSGAIANGYLQWKYGWKPLCSDIYGLYQEAQSDLLKGPMMLNAERNVRSNWDNSSQVANWIERTQQCKVINTCSLHARLSDAFVNSAASHGLLNPLSLGWEIVPYSFVVDWALPIGNFLSALDATAGLVFVGGFTGQRGELQIEAYLPAILSGQFFGRNVGVQLEAFQYRRIKLSAFPAPVPYVKSPFSTGNVRSALALFRQLLK